MDTTRIFKIKNTSEFNILTLRIYQHQYKTNKVYHTQIKDIPFLPIQFFKSKKIIAGTNIPKTIFSSSGTTGNITSKHYVTDINIYQESYLSAFKLFYGNIEDYCVIALLPSYLEREGSSLIYMANDLIKKSEHPDSGFYLHQIDELREKLILLNAQKTKVLLLGVSFALLDLIEKQPLALKHTIVMETGGMKGKRKELIREELHAILKEGFGVQQIHSEYGMTELLSQAYSKGDGLFKTPPWMKVLIRDTEDPLTYQKTGKTGGINIIDLANVNSCSFIATQDLGKKYEDNQFEVLGRFDNSDIRGCNLMVL